jgi:hypothetical protein
LESEEHRDTKVGWTTLALAGFATTALDQAMLEPGRSRSLALTSSVGVFVAILLIAARGLARQAVSPEPRRADLASKLSGSRAKLALLGLFALPFAWEAGRLILSGRAAMAELTLLTALRNLGLGLAALAG